MRFVGIVRNKNLDMFQTIFLLISLSYCNLCRPMILVFKHFFYKNYVGLSLWPFIFVKSNSFKEDAVLINHEKIHLRQQRELLILPFYVLYITEWMFRAIWYLNTYRAYQNISFEREAYTNENQADYLSKRTPFSFIKYLYD